MPTQRSHCVANRTTMAPAAARMASRRATSRDQPRRPPGAASAGCSATAPDERAVVSRSEVDAACAITVTFVTAHRMPPADLLRNQEETADQPEVPPDAEPLADR